MNRRAFLAWEIGAGRGHIVKLAAIAQALKRRGFANSAHLVHMDFASEISDYCVFVAACTPLSTHAGEEHHSSASYGDWLRWHRFDDPIAIRTAIERWRAAIVVERPAVVIADQAPCAVLAARSLGIPAVRVGVPVTTPPAHLRHFPAFIEGQNRENYSEDQMRDAVNEAISGFSLSPLSNLPAVLQADDDIAATIPPLDPYHEWRVRPAVSPVTGSWREPGERRRQEVFVYLSGIELEAAVLTAIGTLNLPTRVVISGNPQLAVAVANWRAVIVEPNPLPPAEIARNTRVIVHAGNHGTTCLGLRGGIPHVIISHLLEHRFDGQQLQKMGVGINVPSSRWTVPTIHAAIRETWDNSKLAERAARLADELAPHFIGDPGEMIADRVEALLR